MNFLNDAPEIAPNYTKNDQTSKLDVDDVKSENCPFEFWNEKTVFDGKYVSEKQVNFRKKGKSNEGVWQSARRSNRPQHCGSTGVNIIAVLKKEGKKYFILEKQYRIPPRSWVIEFPAGLVDFSDANAIKSGIREFKEETGYTITKVLSCSDGKQYLDPGLTDDSCRIMMAEVDGKAPENLNPRQKLDQDEAIEVILVECEKLKEFLDDVIAKKKAQVDAKLYTFALGCEYFNEVT